MEIRNTDADKWQDPWFRRQGADGQRVFLWLCDRCDRAGFWKVDLEQMNFDLRLDVDRLEEVLKKLSEPSGSGSINMGDSEDRS